ncbi:MAG: hypothetical protein ABIV47_16825 [Roseiflexaceae bacterium]
MTQPLTIYVIQSAHTDIGYTHPQEQILLMYLEHYDRVLELCRATEDAPEPQRFKWVCETSWQVRHYLTHRPERLEAFLYYARRGQIEVTASYLHFTDLIDPDAYRRSLEWVVQFCAQHALPLRTAMHCDINGWPWALADILAEHNIPYFCSQVHIDNGTDPLGRRGSVHYHWTKEWGDGLVPDVPVRIPQAFWWQGPQGGRVLHWLNEHYMLGNVLGISSYKPFGADKTRYFLESDDLTAEALYDRARHELPSYIERLRAGGYAHPIMLLSTGGFYVDNSPPDGRWLEVIQRWNAEHSQIVLRTATLSEWFAALETLGDDLPTHAVAWPDHWAHGLGSQSSCIAQARRTQRRRATAIALVEQSQSPAAAVALATALEQERLALEHTFDAWSTTAHPAASANAFQHAAKELTFHRAEMYLDEAIGMALRTLASRDPAGPQLYVYQPDRAPSQTLHFDGGDRQLDPTQQVLRGTHGRTIPFQRDHPDLPQFVAVVPPSTGLRSFAITAHVAETSTPNNGLSLTTAAWSLSVDPATGGLSSLRDAHGREWVDSAAEGFGQLIHTTVVHPLGREAVGNTARLVQLDVAGERLRAALTPGPIVETSTVTFHAQPNYQAGPVFDEIVLQGDDERIGALRVAWRNYHDIPLVELVLDWDKRWSDLPEAAYVAFPFATHDGQLELETSGGFFTPGSHAVGGQLPGTCSSFYTVQRAAKITTDSATLLWLPLDAPLVMINAIDYNRWETAPYAWNGMLASMPVNHYWHTNFPTSQRGALRLRYRLVLPAADTEQGLQTALPLDALGWR